MKNIAFFDVDNVLVKGQTQKMLVSFLFRKKRVNLLFLLDIYLWFVLYKLNLAKDVFKIRERAFTILEDWDFNDSKKLFNEFFDKRIKPRLNSAVVEKLKKHISDGDEVVLLSASLGEIVIRLKEFLGLRYSISTELEVINGKYSGKFTGIVPYGENKLSSLRRFIDQNKIIYKKCFVYADHFSDKAILEFSTNPIIVNPDKKLRKLSITRNWPVYDF